MNKLVALIVAALMSAVLLGACKSTSVDRNARRFESTRLGTDALAHFRELWSGGHVPGLPPGGVIQTEFQGYIPQRQVQFPHIVTIKIMRPSEPEAVYYYVLSMQTPESNWKLVGGEKTDLAGNRLRKYRIR